MDDDGRRPARSGLSDPASEGITALMLATLLLAGLGMLNGETHGLTITSGGHSVGQTVVGLIGAAIAAAGVGLGLGAATMHRTSWHALM